MKIAISSPDGKINTQFSARFGRCQYYVFFNGETREWESKLNPAAAAGGGAGTRVVQFLIDQGVSATITGRYGPNAYTALKAAGIKTFQADRGTPEELLEMFNAGLLEKVDTATGQQLH